MPAETVQLRSYWQTKDAKPGYYKAYANIDYDGEQPAYVETGVRLGDIFLKITNVTWTLNSSIAKLFIDIESNWNQKITDVYAELIIKNEDNEIANIKTSSINLEPWGKDQLIGFWEKEGLSAGKYDIEIFVYYYDKSAQEQVQVELTQLLEQPSEKEDGANYLLISIIVLLIFVFLVNIVLFLVIFKSRNKDMSKNKDKSKKDNKLKRKRRV